MKLFGKSRWGNLLAYSLLAIVASMVVGEPAVMERYGVDFQHFAHDHEAEPPAHDNDPSSRGRDSHRFRPFRDNEQYRSEQYGSTQQPSHVGPTATDRPAPPPGSTPPYIVPYDVPDERDAGPYFSDANNHVRDRGFQAGSDSRGRDSIRQDRGTRGTRRRVPRHSEDYDSSVNQAHLDRQTLQHNDRRVEEGVRRSQDYHPPARFNHRDAAPHEYPRSQNGTFRGSTNNRSDESQSELPPVQNDRQSALRR